MALLVESLLALSTIVQLGIFTNGIHVATMPELLHAFYDQRSF